MKRAIILLNLGGPLARADIAPFLFNFFMDPAIISAPLPLRFLIAKWISRSRSRGEAGTSYSLLGYRSPLLENTLEQADALEKELTARGKNVKVFVSMRYWHPMADAVAAEVKAWQPDEIVLLPLYPQFSNTTSGSALKDWTRAARQAGLSTTPIRSVEGWPTLSGFIEASAQNIEKELKKAPAGARLLLSAHGLPEKTIRAGDPYQRQCEETAAAIAAKLNLRPEQWRLCYQSRVGPLKWIGPPTDEALKEAARDGVAVIIYPPAFVSEHVETLVEIGLDYRARAEILGIPYFARVETVGTHPAFIGGLADLVATP